jgi:DNA-binding CsgD family transcriptional regulator
MDAVNEVLTFWRDKMRVRTPQENVYSPDPFNKVGQFFTLGPFYYYIINFHTLEFEYMHPSVRHVLGVSHEVLDLPTILSLLHPDSQRVMRYQEEAILHFLYHHARPDDLLAYKKSYKMKIRNTTGDYRLILHQTVAITLTEANRIERVFGVHTDITHLNAPYDHKIAFIHPDGRPNHYCHDPYRVSFTTDPNGKHCFTRRELEIIRHLSEGASNQQIADGLCIAPDTVKTHRKNMLRKSGFHNTTELIVHSIREGLI